MRISFIGLLLLAIGCATAALIRAADESVETIFYQADAHPLDGKHSLEKRFVTTSNRTEYALLFEQKLEKQSSGRYWSISLNGKSLGRLEAHLPQVGAEKSYDGFHQIGLAVPRETLVEGENTLISAGQGQPAVVRNLKLINRPLKEAMRLSTVTIHIVDRKTHQPVPARVTVVDDRGQLAKLYDVRKSTNAVRPGILYTLGTGDSFSLPAGTYTLYATRGMEWGVAKQQLVVEYDQTQRTTLEIAREVDTAGFVACDSHIHTLPGSGHGNATYEERMITIAGEGIEVAIATDHNHISDYHPHQHATGTHSHFHAISGDEVTTHNGHFTAFPLDPTKAVPGGVQGRNPLFLEAKDWSKLIADMREKGAKVVILNHPYWPSIPEGPFTKFHFNRQTGGNQVEREFTFDGIEVAQPANQTPDAYYALEDWLALLNRGTRLTAVGATDSHTVNDPVGQARTYLKSPGEDIPKIDKADVCQAFLEGRASVAVGIFATLTIANRYHMGDVVPAAELIEQKAGQGKTLAAQMRVATSSWVHPREAMIYVNGRRVAHQVIEAVPDRPFDNTLEFSIPVPAHDAHVVAFVLGDSVALPGWTSFDKATQAITNPIYIDGDNDQKYSSPRETAARLIAKAQGNATELTADAQAELLDSPPVTADPAVLVHVKDLLGRNP